MHYCRKVLKKIAPYETPLALSWSDWRKWREETKSNHPIAYFLFDEAPSWISSKWNTITGTYYNLKSKYITKHHHIRIDVDRFMSYNSEGKPSYKNYHWYDADTRLLYVNFQILVDFMEQEEPGEIIDWSQTPEHKRVWDELNEIYNWWINVRPKREEENPYPSLSDYTGFDNREDELDLLFDVNKYDTPGYKAYHEACIKYNELENEWNNEDTEMLIRLITIRNHMWT